MEHPVRTSVRSLPQPQRGWGAVPLLAGAAVGVLLLLASPCRAMPGEVLLEDCQLSSDPLYPLESGVCWGYLLGVWNTHSGYQSAGQVPQTVCAQVPLPIGDIEAAFLDWAKKSPEELQRPASECVLAALRAAFPCPPVEK